MDLLLSTARFACAALGLVGLIWIGHLGWAALLIVWVLGRIIESLDAQIDQSREAILQSRELLKRLGA